MTIYSSDNDEKYLIDSRFLIFTIESLKLINCGYISHRYFRAFQYTYSESIHHNSCLNRKISIDAEGNIKNCPSMTESFGNIRDITLAEAIGKPGFKKYWTINKDKIHVCKDCEFRYICTDCRAYVEDPEDILSKPLKCGYNPYTGEWSEWSTNPLKQKAIDFYGMRDLTEENMLQRRNLFSLPVSSFLKMMPGCVFCRDGLLFPIFTGCPIPVMN